MSTEQHQHIANRYRRLALHETALGRRRLALRYFKLAHEHEAKAIPTVH